MAENTTYRRPLYFIHYIAHLPTINRQGCDSPREFAHWASARVTAAEHVFPFDLPALRLLRARGRPNGCDIYNTRRATEPSISTNHLSVATDRDTTPVGAPAAPTNGTRPHTRTSPRPIGICTTAMRGSRLWLAWPEGADSRARHYHVRYAALTF